MKILIAYDGSEFAKAILDDLRYAGLPSRAEAMVIAMAEPEYFLAGKKADNVVGWLSFKLIEARSSARFAKDRIKADFPGWNVSFEARLASPPDEIARKVMEWKPDLVMIGQHGRGASKRSGLGRVAKRLFKDAKRSVRIARSRLRRYDAPPRIIIPLTASQNLETTSQAVMSRFWPPRTEVKLVASLGPIFSETQIAAGALAAQIGALMDMLPAVERKFQSADLLVTSEIRAGFFAADIIEIARQWRADSVFISAEDISFIERIFCGDFVASVASRAECSVEVARSPVRFGETNFEFGAMTASCQSSATRW